MTMDKKLVGILCEYNPFHDGHAYQIAEAKKRTGAVHAIAVMNGDFVQRGEPAVFDKYQRTSQALAGGADLVFELPIRFGLSSAGDFARGGVLALERLGCTHLCFGSECGDLRLLQDIAHFLAEEPPAFKRALDGYLRQGLSFPAARAKAVTVLTGVSTDLLSLPNNILGVEYCLALETLHSSLQPLTIQRIGQAHNDDSESSGVITSSSALRRNIYIGKKPHLCLEDFDCALGYALLREKNMTGYKDISEDLAGRIRNFLPGYHGIKEFVSACQTRAFTESRIRRALFQCLFDIRETSFRMPYLRLLGGKKEACRLLRHTDLLILSRLAADAKKLSGEDQKLLLMDIRASELYRQTYCIKYKMSRPNEYQRSPVII